MGPPMRRLLRALSLGGSAAALAWLAFACGSNDDLGAPPPCEGSSCVDASGEETSAADTSSLDGPSSDARVDSSASDGGSDATVCSLTSADAGDGGAVRWASNYGVTGRTTPTSVSIDQVSGDVVVAGYFSGTVDFGGGVLASHAPVSAAEADDAFLARFTSAGAFRWAKAYGNGYAVSVNSAATAPSGKVVIAGNFPGAALDLGCGALTQVGNDDVFVAELDVLGNCVWSKSFGTAGKNEGVNNVVVDASGGVFFTGLADSVDFGGGALNGFYLTKLTSAGTHAWSKGFAATTSYGGPWLAVDAQGNAVLAGSFSQTIDLGAGAISTAGAGSGDTTNAAFVAKFDPGGKYQWGRQYGEGISARNASINAVAVDSCGAVFVNGPFGGTINFGTGPLVSDGTKSYGFLAKLDAQGTGVWSTSFAGSNKNLSTNGSLVLGGLAVDRAGRPTLAANLVGDTSFGNQETVDFGGGPLTNVGRKSVAIASFEANGAHRWSYVAGIPSTASQSTPAYQASVASGLTGTVLTGGFGKCVGTCMTSSPGTTVVLAGQTLTAASGQDLFLENFAP